MFTVNSVKIIASHSSKILTELEFYIDINWLKISKMISLTNLLKSQTWITMTYKPLSLNGSGVWKEATPTSVYWPIRHWRWCTCMVSKRISFAEPLVQQHQKRRLELNNIQSHAKYTLQHKYTSVLQPVADSVCKIFGIQNTITFWNYIWKFQFATIMQYKIQILWSRMVKISNTFQLQSENNNTHQEQSSNTAPQKVNCWQGFIHKHTM